MLSNQTATVCKLTGKASAVSFSCPARMEKNNYYSVVYDFNRLAHVQDGGRDESEMCSCLHADRSSRWGPGRRLSWRSWQPLDRRRNGSHRLSHGCRMLFLSFRLPLFLSLTVYCGTLPPPPPLSLSLSLTHTHTHTEICVCVCVCVCVWERERERDAEFVLFSILYLFLNSSHR